MNEHDEAPSMGDVVPPPPSPNAPIPKRRPRIQRRTDVRQYETVEAAAEKLSMSVDALRARCRRSAVREGNTVLAHLGAGIVAYKLGRHWRVRFPAP